MEKDKIYKYWNCSMLRGHKIIKDDLWVRNGIILDPLKCFYEEKANPDIHIDCQGKLLVPGYIELQINGAFGYDFSYNIDDIEEAIAVVSEKLLAHGITSFCPTVITSPTSVYQKVVPKVKKCNGSKAGAGVLGLHLEGPFISTEKKGAHPEDCIISELNNGSAIDIIESVYGKDFYKSTALITVAPEVPGALDAIKELTDTNSIVVSIGHSTGTIKNGEMAVRSGAKFITHLFNAMLPFHHRDPGLVGLLTSWKLPPNVFVYYGLIADGIHTHPATMRIAHRTHPDGLILVSDAIVAAGFHDGTYRFGQQEIEVCGKHAYVAGTKTLCGSIALLDECVRIFLEATNCSIVEALECATLHPAKLLNITDKKGTLDYGTDADFLMLDESYNVTATYIAGECVYKSEDHTDFITRSTHD